MASEDHVIPSSQDATRRALELLQRLGLPAPDVIGHRIVHGGPQVLEHTIVTEAVVRKLEAAATFAPLHAPAALAILGISQSRFPGIPQVACLDTVFHAHMPEVARQFPLPPEFDARGIRRYGFHGISCESIIRRLGATVPPRMVIAHLGSGASVTAVQYGQSLDTSMALTPTSGMMMATRSGDLDPGLLLYLIRTERYSVDTLETLLDRQSGLTGVSGVSGDLRELHRAAPKCERARLAIAMYCYSARKHISAMVSALEGLDLLVFTGGIGEHDENIRAGICSGLVWIGSVSVRTMASMEEEQIALHATRLTGR